MLIQLKATKHGSPHVDDSDVPWYLSGGYYEPESDASWEVIHRRWAHVLDELIWTFEQLIDKDDWQDRYTKQTDIPHTGDMAFFGNKYEFDRDGMDLHQKAINNGLRLFGKYYYGLWD
jgi:hypothetical protein